MHYVSLLNHILKEETNPGHLQMGKRRKYQLSIGNEDS
jgi:hypothetical protein